MDEEWRDVKNYEGRYSVSSKGRVFSHLKNIYLKQSLGTTGYYFVNLWINKGYKSRKIHQLVAESFLNHTPCGFKIVVDHIDSNKLNNNVQNLRLVSNRENTSKKRKGTSSKYIGVHWCNTIKKWRSSICYKGEYISLGRFNNEVKAKECYENALISVSKGEKPSSVKRTEYSSYKGVSKIRNSWVAYIYDKSIKRNKYLGSFKTESEAIEKIEICKRNGVFTVSKPKFKRKYNGVYCIDGKYIARVNVNRKAKHLGTFNTPEEARDVVVEYKLKNI